MAFTHGARQSHLAFVLLLLLVALLCASLPPSVWAAPSPQIQHHELTVSLSPADHRLVAQDRLTVALPPNAAGTPASTLSFHLSPALRVTKVQARLREQSVPVSLSRRVELSADMAGESTQVVTLRFADPIDGAIQLDWQYEGVVHDPPKEPRHLRFVTPSETAGFIGPEGVYLSSESQWYPDLPGSRATFRVQVTVPSGWRAVTHGRELDAAPSTSHTALSTWEVREATEALTLVANRFVRNAREWRDASGRSIRLETDFLPENASLADEYLDASARYIEAYSRLLGPYPFDKFAVVENFFASGLGMPSFTLLGSGSIKRHYVQPYALGHEIVHSWIGNAVFNRPHTGNWVEGLTTYLANYYYDELTGNLAQAKEQRRLMVTGYAVYVSPEEDYPVGQFMQKTDQKDNAIGYQKAAMFFHALRREVGDATFWRAIKQLGTDYRWQPVDWGTLEQLVSEAHGAPLRSLFAQWVERAGAPTLTVTAHPVSPAPVEAGSAAPSRREVRVRVVQSNPPFLVELPLVVIGADGARSEHRLRLTGVRDDATLAVPFEPTALIVDPDVHVFRRLDRAELPPMLNLLATDRQRTVIVAASRNGEEASVYRRIVERMTEQPTARQSEAEGSTTTVVEQLEGPDAAVGGSLLFLGADQLEAWKERSAPACADQLAVTDEKVSLAGMSYESRGVAVLLSCPRRTGSGHVATLFFGTTPEAAGRVARLLFFYGWQSYLVFRDGAVVARGDMDSKMSQIQVTSE